MVGTRKFIGGEQFRKSQAGSEYSLPAGNGNNRSDFRGEAKLFFVQTSSSRTQRRRFNV